jgi:hypothetical protein
MEDEHSVTLGNWLDLREDLRAAEALMEDLPFAPEHLERYWAMSAQLITLLQDVDAQLERWRERGRGDDEQDIYLAMRRRVVTLQAATEEIRWDEPEE